MLRRIWEFLIAPWTSMVETEARVQVVEACARGLQHELDVLRRQIGISREDVYPRVEKIETEQKVLNTCLGTLRTDIRALEKAVGDVGLAEGRSVEKHIDALCERVDALYERVHELEIKTNAGRRKARR